ncbi:MAG: DUF4166 domain-containing protein [Sphingomicrobium sp.]
MSLILVIGGYGGFGERLCHRLAAAGHELIVAGRTLAKAQGLCAQLPHARPLIMDRTREIAEVLARERPDLVIDAAGPFQDSGYQVPLACIAARVPYIDLADSTNFVAGIEDLDEVARTAGVAVIAGASSVPALTGAVARKLAAGLDQVHAVDIALSAANRATGGASVIAAILSYVGQPVRVWRSGRWGKAYGWQELRREDFVLSDGSGLRGRYVAIADVPDCVLMPPGLPGHPAVTFRAGTELGFHMVALWLASWAVRWGWLRSLTGAAPFLLPLYRLTERIGGERSAMKIVLWGSRGKERLERSWTIFAERGDGLEVPTLAAEILAAEVLAGRCAPGARTAADMLSFAQFEPRLSKIAVRYEFAERVLRAPLYRRVLGPAFDALPDAVRGLHYVNRDAGAAGEGRVERGRGLAARALARAMGMPPEGSWPLHVAFAERDGVETWTRDFGGHRFTSELSGRAGELIERFGPIRFHFTLPAGERGLSMTLTRWTLFGVLMPRRLAPAIVAREWEEDGRFRFDVAVAMPLAGRIVRYTGWLMPCPPVP